jgi:hypothetical protein
MTTMPLWVSAVGLIVLLPVLAVIAQVALRRSWPALREGEHNDVVGFIIAVVGVIYAVLLAFVVIVSWEKYTDAEGVVGQEASALRTIYRDSTPFPPDTRDRVHTAVRAYATAAIEQEWPAMSRGESGAPEVARVLDDTSILLSGLPTGTPAQQAYLQVEADRFNDLITARSRRLDFVEQGVPGVLWTALIIGGVVTIGFAMIFGLRSAVLHTLMTASLAALIGVLLFVSVAIDKPFAGDVHVGPEPLERVLHDLNPAGS